jgi:hypothetical protein
LTVTRIDRFPVSANRVSSGSCQMAAETCRRQCTAAQEVLPAAQKAAGIRSELDHLSTVIIVLTTLHDGTDSAIRASVFQVAQVD